MGLFRFVWVYWLGLFGFTVYAYLGLFGFNRVYWLGLFGFIVFVFIIWIYWLGLLVGFIGWVYLGLTVNPGPSDGLAVQCPPWSRTVRLAAQWLEWQAATRFVQW